MKKWVMLIGLIALIATGCIQITGSIDTGDTTGTTGGTRNISWSTTAQELSGGVGTTYTVTLPPGGTSSTIWGTDIYTADSPIGTAAVHCGLATFQGGGTFKVVIREGRSSYAGSIRNGVQSQAWGSYERSYELKP